MWIPEAQRFLNVSFCQIRKRSGEELRFVLQTFSSISLRWEVLVKCEKFTSVVCVAVQNKPKIRMNNWDSKFFFCFHQARKSKQRGKNCGHTHSTGWRSAARYFEDLFPSRRSLSFTTSSTVHMYDFHIFTVIYSLLHRFIWNKYNEHFPVSLVAQLIERWSGLNFFLFKALFSLLLK